MFFVTLYNKILNQERIEAAKEALDLVNQKQFQLKW